MARIIPAGTFEFEHPDITDSKSMRKAFVEGVWALREHLEGYGPSHAASVHMDAICIRRYDGETVPVQSISGDSLAGVIADLAKCSKWWA